MLELTEQNYLTWQKKLRASALYRVWWQFWSNYSLLILFILPVCILRGRLSWQTLLIAFGAFVIARFVVITILNLFYQKPRPYQKYNFEPIASKLLSWKTSRQTSFPSRHMISLGAIAGVILLDNLWLGLVLFVVAALAGLGRVRLGFHDYYDISVGLVLGGVIGVMVWFSFFALF
ncbi:MAG: phosphatase PAP2 family protein [Candidatus Doudnabacteria bacterium]